MTERKILKLNSVLSEAAKKKLISTTAIKKNDAQKKKEKKEKIFITVRWLTLNFPKCFNIKRRLPFKLNIEQDIFIHPGESSPSRNAIRQALKWYVHGKNYLKQMAIQVYRIDLDGQQVQDQPISQEHKDYALKTINHLNSKKKFR